MKKLIGVFVVCLILILAACESRQPQPPAPEQPPAASAPGDTPAPPEYNEEDLPGPPEPCAPLEINLQMALASDALLSGFSQLHEAYFREPGSTGNRLVIWSDSLMRDMAVMMVESDFDGDRWIFTPVSTHGYVDEVLPGQAYVINGYYGGGTLPSSGVTFVDKNGQRRYFVMQEDMSGWLDPSPHSPDFIDLFEDGQVQVALGNGSVGWLRDITITLDENGSFDPDAWFAENRHIWALFVWFEIDPHMSGG